MSTPVSSVNDRRAQTITISYSRPQSPPPPHTRRTLITVITWWPWNYYISQASPEWFSQYWHLKSFNAKQDNNIELWIFFTTILTGLTHTNITGSDINCLKKIVCINNYNQKSFLINKLLQYCFSYAYLCLKHLEFIEAKYWWTNWIYFYI